METRLASVKDAPFLTALHAESFGEAGWNVAQITDSLALATTYAWIAQEGGVPVGFIFCQIAGDEADILTLCVTPSSRGRGIAFLLLETLLATAQRQETHRVFLEVAVDNPAALALYRKAGFRSNGIRPNYYHRGTSAVDAVMLERGV